ncbi:MAG: radical SAM protein, partial [Candidatus Omnitrophota bacterium]
MRKLVTLTIILFLAVIFPAHFSYAEKSAPRVASYWNKVKDNIVQCVLCPRKCIIDNGRRGLCTVRVNKDGVLYTLGYGNPVAVHIDPIEKKPFFNVL